MDSSSSTRHRRYEPSVKHTVAGVSTSVHLPSFTIITMITGGPAGVERASECANHDSCAMFSDTCSLPHRFWYMFHDSWPVSGCDTTVTDCDSCDANCDTNCDSPFFL